jgi:hypothetical protein
MEGADMNSTSVSVLAGHQSTRGMPADYVGALSGVAKHVKVPSRHRLVEEGSKADRFWLIQARQVALDMQVPAAAGGHRGAGHGRRHWLVLAVPAVPIAVRRHRDAACPGIRGQ